MSRASRWMVKAALVHLLLGVTAGAAMLTAKAGYGPFWAPSHRPAHIEVLLVGWLVQFPMGVAFWILPRSIHGGPGRRSPLAWPVFALINAGALAAGVGAMLPADLGFFLAGRIAEAAAGGLFVFHATRRVQVVARSAASRALPGAARR